MTSQATFDAILNNLEDGLVIHDSTLRVVHLNQKALDILGVTVEQLKGKTPMDPQWKMVREDGSPFPHEDNPAVLVMQTGEKVTSVMGIECGMEPLRWIRIQARPFEIENQRHAIVTFTDITEELLYEVQNELVLRASGVGIWRYYVQSQELLWDASMYRLYGVQSHDFTGDYDAWRKTLHPDDLSRCEQEVAMAVNGTKPFDTTFRILLNNQVKLT
jgi:PAS domain-containing protein